MNRVQIALPDAAATHALGVRIGKMLKGGEFIALCGPLGAGKTHLVKGIAIGIGVPAEEPIVSPTFVLIREYQGRLGLLHADAYRIGSADEWRALGAEEAMANQAVLAVEWADRFPEIVPEGAIWVELEYADDGRRAFLSGIPPIGH